MMTIFSTAACDNVAIVLLGDCRQVKEKCSARQRGNDGDRIQKLESPADAQMTNDQIVSYLLKRDDQVFVEFRILHIPVGDIQPQSGPDLEVAIAQIF